MRHRHVLFMGFIGDGKICQELLFARNSEKGTEEETIFNVLEKFCDEIRLNDIVSAAYRWRSGYDTAFGCEEFK